MAETIKEFLVSLGWKVEENQQRNFVSALEAATLRANLLAEALEGVARKAAAMVANVVQSFDQLYFMSQRTNTSIETITKFTYAVEQLGGSASDARGSVEAITENLRKNPGYITWLNELGFGLNKTTKQLEVQKDLMENAAKMPYVNAKQLADQVGESEKVLQAMHFHPKEFWERMNESGESLARSGIDPKKAGKDANEFSTKLRDTLNDLGNIKNAALTNMMEKLLPILTDFDVFIKTHQTEIGKALKELGDSFAEVAGKFETWLKGLIGEDANKSFRDTASSLGGLTVAFETFFAIWAASKFLVAIAAMSRMAGFLGAIYGASELIQFGAKGSIDAGPKPGEGTAGGIGALNGNSEDAKGLGINPGGDGDGTGFFGGIKKWWRNTAPTALGGGDAKTSDAGPSGGGAAYPISPYSAPSMTNGTGFNLGQYNAFKEGLTDIEGKDYGRMGGAGGRFAGRYQMGGAEITETAKRLGVPRPSNEEFLASPPLQEQFFENYTLDHYSQLMKNPTFAAMSPDKKLEMLGYAHNQGVGGALNYLKTGTAGSDAWGTSGTAYFGTIRKRLAANLAAASKGESIPPVETGRTDKGRYLNGTWFPSWVHPSNSYFDGTAWMGKAHASEVSPDANGFDKVEKDNAQGSAQIKKWETPIPTIKAPLSPYGGLDLFHSPGPLGGTTVGDTTHINAPQHTEIHIDGTGDPTSVAHMVGANQNRIAADMARNLQGATQ